MPYTVETDNLSTDTTARNIIVANNGRENATERADDFKLPSNDDSTTRTARGKCAPALKAEPEPLIGCGVFKIVSGSC